MATDRKNIEKFDESRIVSLIQHNEKISQLKNQDAKNTLLSVINSLRNNEICPFLFHNNCKNADCFCAFFSALFSWRYCFFCGKNGPLKAVFMLEIISQRFSANCVYQKQIKEIIKSFIDEMNEDIKKYKIPHFLHMPIIHNVHFSYLFFKKYIDCVQEMKYIQIHHPPNSKYWSIDRIMEQTD